MIESPKKLKGLKSSQQKEKLLTISQDELSEESGPSLGVWRDGEGSQEAEGFRPYACGGLWVPPTVALLFTAHGHAQCTPSSVLIPQTGNRGPETFRAWPGGEGYTSPGLLSVFPIFVLFLSFSPLFPNLFILKKV